MKPYASADFKIHAAEALVSTNLQKALRRTTNHLQNRRLQAYSNFTNFEALRSNGSDIKTHTIKHLANYLEMFEASAQQTGAQVLWAQTGDEASEQAVSICKKHNGSQVTRVKSMLGEEIGLPLALDNAGITRVETDLAEHINQLAGDFPSHIVIPAMHKTREEVTDLFAQHHIHHQSLEEIPALVQSAREHLRDAYFDADVSISGANFLIADSGTMCLVTNEGNAELTIESPDVQIVIASIDKLVPSMQHCRTMLRLLARSALGMELTQYTTFLRGPRARGESTGPKHLYIILVDNNRTAILDSDMRDILKCIRCAACINHCPVYSSVGGHAYGGTYQGPMGSILNPALDQLKRASDLPQACTLNGRCQQVCPVKIPLPRLLRRLREQAWREKITSGVSRHALQIWVFLAVRPRLYHKLISYTLAIIGRWPFGTSKGISTHIPGTKNWTKYRDLPRLPTSSFLNQYFSQQEENHRKKRPRLQSKKLE